MVVICSAHSIRSTRARRVGTAGWTDHCEFAVWAPPAPPRRRFPSVSSPLGFLCAHITHPIPWCAKWFTVGWGVGMWRQTKVTNVLLKSVVMSGSSCWCRMPAAECLRGCRRWRERGPAANRNTGCSARRLCCPAHLYSACSRRSQFSIATPGDKGGAGAATRWRRHRCWTAKKWRERHAAALLLATLVALLRDTLPPQLHPGEVHVASAPRGLPAS
jgi:hypothetical protein